MFWTCRIMCFKLERVCGPCTPRPLKVLKIWFNLVISMKLASSATSTCDTFSILFTYVLLLFLFFHNFDCIFLFCAALYASEMYSILSWWCLHLSCICVTTVGGDRRGICTPTYSKVDPEIITKLLSIFGCRKKDPQTSSDDCATIFLMWFI